MPTGLECAREMIQGISEVAHTNPAIELHLVSSSGNIQSEKLSKESFDGLIGFTPYKHLEKLQKLAPHVVSTSNRDLPEAGDFVFNDDIAIGRMGAEYLIRRGFRGLIFAGQKRHHYAEQRFQGFQKRAAESGIEAARFDIYSSNDEKSIPEILMKLPPRCGIMAANDEVAKFLMKYTDQPLSRIPLHFALLGVDNDPLLQSLLPIPLSSIEVDGKGIGKVAINRLIARMENPDLQDEIIRIPPLRIHTRQSTDLFALNDELVVRALQLMDEELPEICDVGNLVERLGTPRRTLELRFRNATGRTLAKEMSILRVERARDFLRNTDMDTEAIAKAVGLPESRMLWLLFKRLTGESPSAYRKRMPV